MKLIIYFTFVTFFRRDLAFALFCASAKKEKRANNAYSNDSMASDNTSSKWSIPGCQFPVSCE